MGVIIREYKFIADTVADADEVNKEFDTIYDEFNGSIDGNNISSSSALYVALINTTGNGVVGGTLGVTGNTTLSGTLGVTGTTTLSTLTLSGAITSTLASGTAPLIVTSTTKVTNLNADKVDDYNVSGTSGDLKRIYVQADAPTGATNAIWIDT